MPDATPVALDLCPEVAPAVRRWVDRIGWQVVEPDTDDLVPPVLALTDVRSSTPAPHVPAVLLVAEDDDPAAAAARASAIAPAAVLRWPAERDRLQELATTAIALGVRDHATETLAVGGSAGGVGTTTIALTLAGLAAWRGRATLVAARGHVPCPAVPSVRGHVLEGAGAWRAAAPVPGVPGLRVIRVESTAPDRPATARLDGADLVVVDRGVDAAADVLVLRRDAAGLDALARSACAVAVVVDHGPVPPRSIAAAAAGRRIVAVPPSTRVARAALAQRVPAGLPGAWLRSVAPALRGG